jgi:hypothetical protein
MAILLRKEGKASKSSNVQWSLEKNMTDNKDKNCCPPSWTELEPASYRAEFVAIIRERVGEQRKKPYFKVNISARQTTLLD